MIGNLVWFHRESLIFDYPNQRRQQTRKLPTRDRERSGEKQHRTLSRSCNRNVSTFKSFKDPLRGKSGGGSCGNPGFSALGIEFVHLNALLGFLARGHRRGEPRTLSSAPSWLLAEFPGLKRAFGENRENREFRVGASCLNIAAGSRGIGTEILFCLCRSPIRRGAGVFVLHHWSSKS